MALLFLAALLATSQLAGQPRATGLPTATIAGGQRYSPLADITPDNVAQLEIAWTYHMRPQTDAGGAIDVDGARQRNAEGLAIRRRVATGSRPRKRRR